MRFRLFSAVVAAVLLTSAAVAQDSVPAPPAGQGSGPGNGGGYGRRGGGMGRGMMGTVTEMTTDHFTMKTEIGEIYTVHFTADTRFVKQPPRGAGGAPGEGGYGRGMGAGGNPPQRIRPADIKIGDAIAAMGDTDAAAKSIAAERVMLLDPETAARMQQMAASYGKTWLQGKVTAINGTKITLTGALDNAAYTIVADENTTFRRRRDPVTLADIQIGDNIRVEGAMKDGIFAASAINVGGMMGGTGPGGPSEPPAGAPSGPPPSAPRQ